MNERDLRPALIHRRLSAIRDLLGDLDRLGEPDAEELAADRFTRHVAERIVSALTDLAVGINSHLCATTGQAVPGGAADTFDAVIELGALDRTLGSSLRGSVGLRNVIVHEYADVDLSILAAALPLARSQFAAYVTSIAG